MESGAGATGGEVEPSFVVALAIRAADGGGGAGLQLAKVAIGSGLRDGGGALVGVAQGDFEVELAVFGEGGGA